MVYTIRFNIGFTFPLPNKMINYEATAPSVPWTMKSCIKDIFLCSFANLIGCNENHDHYIVCTFTMKNKTISH